MHLVNKSTRTLNSLKPNSTKTVSTRCLSDSFMLFFFTEFVNFDKTLEEKLNDIVKQLARKSNIKDVCALLDMKSSKYYTFQKFLTIFFKKTPRR